MKRTIGGATVEQEREGRVMRTFDFFRDRDGKPWMSIKDGETDASFSFSEAEYQDFVAAAQLVSQ